MSRTIDEKVVEMRFDNRQFQSATAATMSTLDKLKAKLNFNGATKGLDGLASGIKKIDMNSLGRAVDTVKVKFSALEVMGVTALANITNTAVNAGKRIASALTIDPIKTGFQEYETQLNSVQTILANTSSKGSTLEDVNAALSELNKYADQTIYNFTEMTRNIGTFTAAGVDLDKSVTSIKGIANLAAVSGSNAQQASAAMYQLSQALAAGRVSLMDWNSVVNAGMGGELFQNALKRTAKQMGYNVDALIEKYGSFRESLTKGQWLTAEVLTETLTQLSGAYSEADLIAQGYTEKQAKEIVELAETAVNAATNVKTVTQLWDTMKEAVQSGWAQTWQILIGNFEEAKTLFSRLSNFFNGFIESQSNARNEFLTAAFAPKASWEDLTKKINDAGVSTETFVEKIKEVGKTHNIEIDKIIEQEGSLANAFRTGALSSDLVIEALEKMSGSSATAVASTEDLTAKLKKFQKIVDDTWRGDYGNGVDRMNAYAKAGYNYAEVQALVNKSVDGYRLKLEDLSDEQLKSIGYTDEQIAAINQLAKDAKTSGTAVSDLIEELSQPSGRDLIIETMFNILEGIADVLGAIGKAWRETFSPIKADSVYDSVKAVHDLVAELRPTETELKQITRIFKGLFSAIDLIVGIVGGGFRLAFTVVNKVLGAANMNMLEFVANISDAITGIHDFIFENEFINSIFDNLADAIVGSVSAIKKWIDEFLKIPEVQKAIVKIHIAFVKFISNAKRTVQDFVGSITNNIKSIPEIFKNIGDNAIQGFKDGLTGKASSAIDLIINFGKSILEAIKDVLGIHSPSTEMHEVGTNIVQGLINGISSGIDMIVTVVKGIASKIIEVMKDIPWDSIISAGLSFALLYMGKQILGLMDAISAPMRGLGNVFEGFGEVLEGLGKQLSAGAFATRLNAIKGLAIGLAILAGSIFLLAQLDTGKLWSAIGAMGALAGIITALSLAIGKWGPQNSLKFGSFALALLGISASLLIAASAIKKLSKIDPDQLTGAIASFVAIVAALGGLVASYAVLAKGSVARSISGLGTMFLKLSVSMLLMVAVIKLISGLSVGEVIKGGAAITAFVGVIYLLGKTTKAFGNADIAAFGKMLTQLSASMLIMTVVVKLLGGMDVADIVKGEAAILGFVGITYLLAQIIKKFGVKEATKLGTTLLGISSSMIMLAAVTKIMSKMSVGDIIKGEAAILGFVGIIKLLSTILTTTSSAKIVKIGGTVLAMSAAIGIMGITALLLGKISIPGLAKGLIAITMLGAVLSAMIESTRGAKNVRDNLVVMSVAIGIMAASVAVLSFIDPLSLAGATASMSMLMGMFALIEHSAKDIKGSMGTLIVMTVAVAALAAILVTLSNMPVENSLASAASLSMLMASLAIMMRSINGIGKIAPKAYLTLGVMVLTVGGLATILGLLTAMDVAPSLETAASLSLLLLSLSAACIVLAAVGKTGAAALQGALVLDGAIVILGGLMFAIGALGAYYPDMQKFADEGITLLGKIGYGLGNFFGSIAGGFMAGVASGLPDIATRLAEFMEALKPFIEGVSSIDSDVLDSVKSLAQIILILTATDILNGIISFFGGGGNSLEAFADQLTPFGNAIVSFSNVIKDNIDAASIEAAANAGKTLAELAATLPRQGGLLQKFLGEQDLATFSDQLTAFGLGVVGFSGVVSGKVDAASVESAANSGMSLAELAAALPKHGGFLQDFLGEQDLSVFASQLVRFGVAIVQFSETVANKVDAAAVEAAANAGKTMTSLATTLPKQGGFLQKFLGEQDLGVFGTQLQVFGEAVVGFSKTIVEGGINPEAVTAAANAGAAMAELAKSLPNTGGLVSFFTGNNDMDKFGEQLENFGESFAAYYTHIRKVKPDVVESTSNAAESIVKIAKSIPNSEGLFGKEVTIDEFGEQLSKFGSKFAEYYSKISGINPAQLTSVVAEIDKLIDVAKRMSSVDTEAMSNFGSALKKLGNSGIQGFIDAFEDGTPKVEAAASGTVSSAANAVTRESGRLTDAFDSLANNALDELKSEEKSFYSAGSSLVDELNKGINDKADTVKTAARNLPTGVINATTDTLGIHSPSKVFYGIGNNIVQGLKNGIQGNSGGVINAMTTIGSNLVKAIKRTLSIKSPSRVMRDEVGKYIVEGISEGITEDMSAEEAASQKAQNITSAFQEELDKLDMADTTAELESQLYGNSIDYAAKYERQLKRVELALGEYENMLEHVGKTAKETQEAYNKYIQAQIDLQQESFDHSLEWIEERKNASKLSLVEEYAAWKRVQARYLEGTEQRKQADQEVLSLQEELKNSTEDYYNELTSIQEEAESKRAEIDQEYEDERTRIKEEANEERLRLDQEYADKEQEINDQLIADIEAVEKEYEDAIKSRTDTLYNAYGLFDEVSAGEDVSGETLMNNLKGQLEAFEDWTDNINELAGKGIDKALLEELREMGPSSAAQIAALNSMTDTELDEYVKLWRKKHELAADQATLELEGMREETQTAIEHLKQDAELELEDYRKTWQEQIDALDEDTNRQLEELRDNWRQQIDDLDAETEEKLTEVRNTWMTNVIGLSVQTQSEFAKMTDSLVNTIGDRNRWDQVGINAITGVLKGVADATPQLVAGVEDAMREALDAANYVLGISSPSKEFAKVGRYSDEGFAAGLKKYSNLVTSSSEEVGKIALDSLRDSFAKISDFINTDIDTQPTIRPVLDLTSVQNGAKKLSTLFSRNKALNISTSIQGRTDEAEATTGSTDNRAPVYSFTQNNYSPKALSRIEIYRQTKNQFSAMGRMVTYDQVKKSAK